MQFENNDEDFAMLKVELEETKKIEYILETKVIREEGKM
jgi:hypothetical protein